MSVEPNYIDLREPSYNPKIKGRLLARYDPARRVLEIKRGDGPELTFDLAKYDAQATQTARDVV